MLIAFGYKGCKRRLGRVADYCLRCREARAFRLVEHRRVPHFYYIPLGRGTVVATTITCESCRRWFPADRGRYVTTLRARKASLEELCDATNPDLPQEIADRLDALERVALGESDPAERWNLIADAFNAVVPDYAARAAATHFNVWSVLAGVGTVPAMFLAIMLGLSLGLGDEAMVGLALTAVAVMVVLMVLALALDPARYYRRRTRPELVAMLAPIRPTAEELVAIKDHLREKGAKIHKRIDPVELAALAAEAPPPR